MIKIEYETDFFFMDLGKEFDIDYSNKRNDVGNYDKRESNDAGIFTKHDKILYGEQKLLYTI